MQRERKGRVKKEETKEGKNKRDIIERWEEKREKERK